MKLPAPRHLLILGSNIDPQVHLPEALQRLGTELSVEAVSAVYASPAVGAPGTPDFHNQAVVVRSHAATDALRNSLRTIEAALGRVRDDDPNAPRTIDIDIIARFDEDGLAFEEPLPDPDVHRHHHCAHPAAELLPLARLEANGPALTDIARGLGATPSGFRRLPVRSS